MNRLGLTAAIGIAGQDRYHGCQITARTVSRDNDFSIVGGERIEVINDPS